MQMQYKRTKFEIQLLTTLVENTGKKFQMSFMQIQKNKKYGMFHALNDIARLKDPFAGEPAPTTNPMYI